MTISRHLFVVLGSCFLLSACASMHGPNGALAPPNTPAEAIAPAGTPVHVDVDDELSRSSPSNRPSGFTPDVTISK